MMNFPERATDPHESFDDRMAAIAESEDLRANAADLIECSDPISQDHAKQLTELCERAELANCPFCGSKNVAVEFHVHRMQVVCMVCESAGPSSNVCKGEDNAIRLWNKRETPGQTDPSACPETS